MICGGRAVRMICVAQANQIRLGNDFQHSALSSSSLTRSNSRVLTKGNLFASDGVDPLCYCRPHEVLIYNGSLH